MPSGGSGGNQTTRVEPPKYQLPYLQTGLGNAQTLYNNQQSGAQQTVAPFSPETQQGLAGITNRATTGSPITGAADSLATQTLNGGFLGSNPHLDATFNRAALQTQNQLSSQFAGSGRNQEASAGLRGQQLNDLATGIYGGAYDAERNRQQQVLGMSPQLANAGYADYDRLLGVGAQRESLNQQQLDAPGANLDSFLNRVSGSMGQTNISGGSRNRTAGAIGGGMMGAQMGSQMGNGNPWATGAGAVLGAFGGGWG
jgi:hypothetical protein